MSTPQDVALIDARKGVSMFSKVSIPVGLVIHFGARLMMVKMIGLLLNMSHFSCPSCSEKHELFGNSMGMIKASTDLGLDILGQLPLVPLISEGGDRGQPIMVQGDERGEEVRSVMHTVGRRVWEYLSTSTAPADVGTRG